MNKKELLLKIIAELTEEDLLGILNEVEEEEPEQQQTQRKRKQKRRTKKPEVVAKETKPKRKGRIIIPGEDEPEPVQPKINRAGALVGPNEFDKMRDVKKLFREDTQWQKAVDPISQGKAEPARRRDKVKFVQSNCLRCGRKQKVSPAFLITDYDTKERGHICQKCFRQGGKGD